jgi:hypothetical protein
MALFTVAKAQHNCGESVTVYWQKGVEGGCNYKGELSMYNGPASTRQWEMEWMDESDTSDLPNRPNLVSFPDDYII